MINESSSVMLTALRDELDRRRTHLLDQIQATAGAQAEAQQALFSDGRAALDPGEASADRAQLELLALEERALRRNLAEVNRALNKFTLGTYGRCEYCGAPIPFERLKIVPEARYDVRHQAEAEAHREAATTVVANPAGETR